MKNLILIIAVIVLSACATTTTMKSVAGTYEEKKDGDTSRLVLLDNGISEIYINGKKEEKDGKWKLTKEGEIQGTSSDGLIIFFRINEDSSITLFEFRIRFPKEKQMNLKKIKSPKIKSVVGTYLGDNGNKSVLLDDGVLEFFNKNGEIEEKGKWEISKEGELYITISDGEIGVCRINEDSSLTLIESIRKAPKKEQKTFKKIK